MNWLVDIFNRIKWKIEDGIWAIQDKITLARELKSIDKEWEAEGTAGAYEEIEAKSKKKKTKKKSVKKAKKSV